METFSTYDAGKQKPKLSLMGTTANNEVDTTTDADHHRPMARGATVACSRQKLPITFLNYTSEENSQRVMKG
jgi:hypothetical protein